MGLFNLLGRKKDKIVGSSKKMLGFEEMKKNHNYISGIAKETLNPYSVKQREIRNETFENAYNRLGIDEETLGKVYSNYVLKFYISIAFIMILIAIIVNGLLAKEFLTLFSSIGVACVIISQAISGSFRASQINKRELITFKEWYSDSENWFPSIKRKTVQERKRRTKKSKSVVKYNAVEEKED